MQNIDELAAELRMDIEAAGSLDDLEAVRVRTLGRKGTITHLMKELGAMEPEERRAAGTALNALKDETVVAIEDRRTSLRNLALTEQLATESIDVTLPVRAEGGHGRIHPVSQVVDEIVAIFADMGFAVAEGPDIEDDFHNFTALNIPPEHPARQMHDTFYLEAERDGAPLVLRTHTSPVQIRHMRSSPPPYRVIAPGRTFRCDSDMTHTPMFHQVEGLAIGHDIHMGHLKGFASKSLPA